MNYHRLHQARNEEIEAGASRGKQGLVGKIAIVAKFRYNSKIFSMYSNFAT